MINTVPPPQKRLRVAFLLADQFTLSAFANFVDVLRLAAQLEAEDRHRQKASEPARHQMAKPDERQPFILSNSGEDELARSFYWQAAGGAVLCLAGATIILLGPRLHSS